MAKQSGNAWFCLSALAAVILATSIAGCQSEQGSTPEANFMSVEQVGKKGTKYNCYNITMTNTDKERKATDLHFKLPPGAASHEEAPAGWDWTLDTDGTLKFQTPPANPVSGGGGTTPAANPISPGKELDGFRFCLPELMPNVSAEVSYETGANSTVEIIQGVPAGSGKPVRHTTELRCVKVKITAPKDADVYDVHFARSVADSSAGFDDVSLPDKWSGGPGGGSEELSLDAEKDPLTKGKSVEITICLRGQPGKIEWKFTDKNHQDISNAKGTTTLTY